MGAARRFRMDLEIAPLQAGIVRVTATGKLDEWTVSRLRELLLDGSRCDAAGVLLDLSGVEAIDSAGIALLILARI